MKGDVNTVKKVVLIFFALCMMTTVFASPMQILAAEEKTVLMMKGRENVDTHEIEIDVTVEENTGVCGMLLSLVYDTSVFTLTDLEYGTAFSSLSPIHTNTETDEGYGIYPFKITYLGEENDTSVGKMMTLHFSVKDSVPDGSYTIALKHERDKDVTYLKDNEILTKNLLIDVAKITVVENKITNIETVGTDTDTSKADTDQNNVWIPVAIGGTAFVGTCAAVISALIKRKKNKKWKKI